MLIATAPHSSTALVVVSSKSRTAWSMSISFSAVASFLTYQFAYLSPSLSLYHRDMLRFEVGATYPSLARAEAAARSHSMGRPVCQSYLKHRKYSKKKQPGKLWHVFHCALQEYEDMRVREYNRQNSSAKRKPRLLCAGKWVALECNVSGSVAIKLYTDHSSTCHVLGIDDTFSRATARGLTVASASLGSGNVSSGSALAVSMVAPPASEMPPAEGMV